MKRLKLPFMICLAVCCLSSVMAIHAFRDLSHSPDFTVPLIAEPAKIDFGIVREDLVRGSTILSNRSNKPLRLLHVLVSCSCSEVQLRQGELMPDETAVLSVALDLRGRRGTTGTSIDVVYVTQDGIQWTLPVTLRAMVEPEN